MRSFIFNFDRSYLLKATASAVSAVLLAWVVLPREPTYENLLPPSPSASNELVVAQYVEHYRDKPIVIVGSSITTYIPAPACRPQNVASIPLQGLSAGTGLEVIWRVGARPDVVFVEVPQLGIGVDRGLIDTIVTPIYWRVQLLIPPLRYSRNWVIQLYQKMQWDLRPFDYTIKFPREPVSKWEQQQAAFFDAILSTLGQPSTIGLTISQLEILVHDLQARGTRVIFFDPVDPRIRNALPERGTRDVLRVTFPDIPIVDAPDQTVPIYRHDGLHLHESSGLQFFNYLMDYAGIPYTAKCRLIGQPTRD